MFIFAKLCKYNKRNHINCIPYGITRKPHKDLTDDYMLCLYQGLSYFSNKFMITSNDSIANTGTKGIHYINCYFKIYDSAYKIIEIGFLNTIPHEFNLRLHNHSTIRDLHYNEPKWFTDVGDLNGAWIHISDNLPNSSWSYLMCYGNKHLIYLSRYHKNLIATEKYFANYKVFSIYIRNVLYELTYNDSGLISISIDNDETMLTLVPNNLISV